jgi:hypothetical protein
MKTKSNYAWWLPVARIDPNDGPHAIEAELAAACRAVGVDRGQLDRAFVRAGLLRMAMAPSTLASSIPAAKYLGPLAGTALIALSCVLVIGQLRALGLLRRVGRACRAAREQSQARISQASRARQPTKETTND